MMHAKPGIWTFVSWLHAASLPSYSLVVAVKSRDILWSDATQAAAKFGCFAPIIHQHGCSAGAEAIIDTLLTKLSKWWQLCSFFYSFAAFASKG